jgi:hypothetical protein
MLRIASRNIVIQQREDVSSSLEQETCCIRVVQHDREVVAYHYQVTVFEIAEVAKYWWMPDR